MASVVEGLAPSLMRDLGRYVQTCAHIEAALWRVLMELKDADPEIREDLYPMLKTRKSTPNLLDTLSKEVGRSSDRVNSELVSLLSEIKSDIRIRHMAVHGAWFPKASGGFKCEYFWKADESDPVSWVMDDREFSAADGRRALEAADVVLERSLELLWHVQGSRVDA